MSTIGRDHLDPVILCGKLDKLLNELSLIKKDKPYRKNMLEHFQSMCVLTLLEYGPTVPKLMFLMEQSKKELSK